MAAKEICVRCGAVYMGTPTTYLCPACRHEISVENGRRVGKLPKKKGKPNEDK